MIKWKPYKNQKFPDGNFCVKLFERERVLKI